MGTSVDFELKKNMNYSFKEYVVFQKTGSKIFKDEDIVVRCSMLVCVRIIKLHYTKQTGHHFKLDRYEPNEAK